MKLWPFGNNLETRAANNGGFTDTLIELAIQQATGRTTAKATATAALEASAAMVGRCFAAARVDAPGPYAEALTPLVLSTIGRALIRSGEAVFVMDVDGGLLHLSPAREWEISGTYDPSTWTYRIGLAGPTRDRSRRGVAYENVVHLRYQVDANAPWKGLSPITVASLSGKLSAETTAALADESAGTRGQVLPIPVDGDDPTVEKLKADIRNLKGNTALVESQRGDWGAGNTQFSSVNEWTPRRIGANPPQALVDLMDRASSEIYAACGIPPQLFSDSDGTAQREGYRRLLHGTIAPLGRIVEEELSAKLDTDVALEFDALFAADLSGRARAFQSLVGGGMDPGQAAALAGLMDTE